MKEQSSKMKELRERKPPIREGKEALMLLQDFGSPSPGFNILIFLLILFIFLN